MFLKINRLIQEEKQSTEARAEELESRVGSLEHMNLRGRPSDRQSPPMSGRSTPNSPNRDYLHKYHTVSSALSSTIEQRRRPLFLEIFRQMNFHFRLSHSDFT